MTFHFCCVPLSLFLLKEGKSDMEFLREEEMVYALHVSSRSYKPITCFQISPKGKVGLHEDIELACQSLSFQNERWMLSCVRSPHCVRFSITCLSLGIRAMCAWGRGAVGAWERGMISKRIRPELWVFRTHLVKSLSVCRILTLWTY